MINYNKSNRINVVDLEKGIAKFVQWLEINGISSYDQYDFWSTKFGQYAKRVYYTNKLAGAFFVGPIFFLELFMPAARKLFVKPKKFPIAEAHLIMAYVNMYKVSDNQTHLDKAEIIARQLLKSSIPGYSGYCWGYPFDWMTNRGLWKGSTPLITSTPYCFEAYLALYDASGKIEYLEIARSIFEFALHDIKNISVNSNEIASSYSPIDTSKVMNASAYRAFVLAEGYKRFQNKEALVLGDKIVNFILNNQNKDGSWLYAIENPQDAFIDHFHTCFVLKNLYKYYLVTKREDIKVAVIRGYEYYVHDLFTVNKRPKPFAHVGRINLVKEETYDYAEAISLGVLIRDIIPEALKLSENLANILINELQVKEGYFVTRISLFGLKNKIPYLRWPQSQLFYALSNLLKYEKLCAAS